MIKSILDAAGIKYRQARFVKPPADTYAIYFDDVRRGDGPDPVLGLDLTRIKVPTLHDVTVELYAPAPDPVAEAAIESAIKSHGLTFDKQDSIWLTETQRYQTIYTFDYTKKE